MFFLASYEGTDRPPSYSSTLFPGVQEHATTRRQVFEIVAPGRCCPVVLTFFLAFPFCLVSLPLETSHPVRLKPLSFFLRTGSPCARSLPSSTRATLLAGPKKKFSPMPRAVQRIFDPLSFERRVLQPSRVNPPMVGFSFFFILHRRSVDRHKLLTEIPTWSPRFPSTSLLEGNSDRFLYSSYLFKVTSAPDGTNNLLDFLRFVRRKQRSRESRKRSVRVIEPRVCRASSTDVSFFPSSLGPRAAEKFARVTKGAGGS